MSEQIIKQPDGQYAVWSTVVDAFILIDATAQDIVDYRVDEYRQQQTKQVDRIINALNAGDRPYYQFTMTFDEALRRYNEVHGSTVTLEWLRENAIEEII